MYTKSNKNVTAFSEEPFLSCESQSFLTLFSAEKLLKRRELLNTSATLVVDLCASCLTEIKWESAKKVCTFPNIAAVIMYNKSGQENITNVFLPTSISGYDSRCIL